MRVAQLINMLESLPLDAQVLAGADFDMPIIDAISAGNQKVILILDDQTQDDVITLDIVGPSETNRWQIVYSSGVLQHQPIGREILDFLVAESVVARIYRHMPAFVEALNSGKGSDFVDKLLDYGDSQ